MPPNTAGFDDVYILTIPSFQWIKLWPDANDSAATGQQYGHHSLTCNVISNAQMLIMGGTFPLASDHCDAPDQFGTHNLDLGEQNAEKAPWKLFVSNLTTYAVPDPIINIVGGSAGGGATKTVPADGFSSNPDLKVLMTRRASIANRTPTRAIPGPTSNAEGDAGHPVSTGAIAGIAVGGAAVLAAAVLGCCWFVRRHRRRRAGTAATPPVGVSRGTGGSAGGVPFFQSRSYTPDGYHPNNPFLQQRSYSRPVELEAPPSGTSLWQGPNGVTYELVSPRHAGLFLDGSTRSGSGSGSGGVGTGTCTGTSEPQTKIDAEGRVWVQVAAASPTSPALSGTSGGGAGGDSGSPMLGHYLTGPGGSHVPHTPTSPGYNNSSSPPTPQMPAEPQELSSNAPRRDIGGAGGSVLSNSAGWDAAHGRPRHQTFYHP